MIGIVLQLSDHFVAVSTLLISLRDLRMPPELSFREEQDIMEWAIGRLGIQNPPETPSLELDNDIARVSCDSITWENSGNLIGGRNVVPSGIGMGQVCEPSLNVGGLARSSMCSQPLCGLLVDLNKRTVLQKHLLEI
jgi:hypothetical protein